MLNLILTIALQATVPVTCEAITKTETRIVNCDCGVTAKNLKQRVCTSSEAPDAIELKEVTK